MPTNIKQLKEVTAKVEVDFHGIKFNVEYRPLTVSRKSIDDVGEGERLSAALMRFCKGWDLVQTVQVPVDDEGKEVENPNPKKVYETQEREKPMPFTEEALEELGYDLMRAIFRAVLEGRSPNDPKSSN